MAASRSFANCCGNEIWCLEGESKSRASIRDNVSHNCIWQLFETDPEKGCLIALIASFKESFWQFSFIILFFHPHIFFNT